MKRLKIMGGVVLCLSLSACGEPTAQEVLVNQLTDVGYSITESNQDMLFKMADDVCAMDQKQFDVWRLAGDLSEVSLYGETMNEDDRAFRTYCINANGVDHLPEWNFS